MLNQKMFITLGKNIFDSVEHVVQNDTGRILICKIVDYEIPSSYVAKMYAEKPSGKIVYNSAVIKNDEIHIHLTNQMLAEFGDVYCQIQLFYNEETITSYKFILKVQESLVDSAAIESTNEFGAFEDSIKTLTQYESKLEAVSNAVEAANERIDGLIIPSGNTSVEVIAARTSTHSGETYTMLGNRLDAMEKETSRVEELTEDIFKMEYKSNIYNTKKAINGNTLLNENGFLTTADGWATTDYIKVEGGRSITINKPRYICRYNKNKEKLMDVVGIPDSSETTINLNDDVEYIRFSFYQSVLESLHVEYDATDIQYRSEYQPPILKYKNGDPVTVDNVINNKYSFRLIGKNLFDMNNTETCRSLVMTGYHVGTVEPSEDCDTSYFIEVGQYQKVSINNARIIAEYNEGERLLAFIDNPKSEPKTFTTEKGTKYLRVSVRRYNVEKTQVELTSVCTVRENPKYGLFIGDKMIYECNESSEEGVSDVEDRFKVEYKSNMYDTRDAVFSENKLLVADGSTIDSNGWNTTDYIKIEPERTITINKARYICQYNEDKQMVGFGEDNPASTVKFINTEADAKYIRFSYYYSVADSLHVQYDGVDLTYRSEYQPPLLKYKNGDPVTVDYVKHNKYSFKLVGKNLFDMNATDGDSTISMAGNNIGSVINGENSVTTDFIEVNSGVQMSVNNARVIALYDASERLISFVDNSNSIPKTFITTSQTKYVRLAVIDNLEEQTQLEYGSKCTSYETPKYGLFVDGKKVYECGEVPVGEDGETAEPVVDRFSLEYKSNIYDQRDAVVFKDKILGTTGNVSNATDWDTTDFLEVEPGRTLTINKSRYIAQYDINKQMVGEVLNNTSNGVASVELLEDTKYIRFSYHDSVTDALHVQYDGEDMVYRSEYQPPILKYKNGDPITVDNVINNKYTFELIGKNLYDPNASNENTTISHLGNNIGATVSSEDCNSSDFISVESNVSMCASNAVMIAEYDKGERLLSFINNPNGSSRSFTTTSETAYIKIAATKEKERLTQLEYGSDVTAYEEPIYGLFINGKKIYELKGMVEPMATTGSSFKISSEKNLFKNEKLSSDCVLSTTGDTSGATGWATTDFIEVIEEREMSVNNARSICQYDSKKNLISYYDNTAPCPPHTFTTEPGTCYVRYSIWGTTANVTQLEYGSECTDHEVYKPVMTLDGYKVSDLPFGQSTATTPGASSSSFDVVPGKNMCDPEGVTTDTILKTNGDIQASSGWCTTDFIPVTGDSEVSIKSPRFYCEYDANKKKILFTDNTGSCPDATFTTQQKTAYIKVSSYNSLANAMQVEYGPECTAFELYKLSMTLNGKKIIDVADLANIGAGGGGSSAFMATSEKNLFNVATVERNKILNATGVTVTANSWNTSDFISVVGEETYSVNDCRYLAQYDSGQNLINYHDNTVSCPEYTFETLDNTAYVRYSMYSPSESQLELGSECTSYANFKGIMTLNGTKVMDLPMMMSGGGGQTALINMSEYHQMVSRDEFEIYKATNYYNKVLAIYRNYAVMVDGYKIGSTISISETGIQGDYHHKVVFNATNFPHLMADSVIRHIILMPYSRNAGSGREGYQTRCVLITEFGQIYHNFPNRETDRDGNSLSTDIIKFDESVVWDLPGRNFPVKTEAEESECYVYHPGLPEVCYQMHPPVNDDNGFGHGGFGKTTTNNGEIVSRFYQPGRSAQTNSFVFMGGFEPDDKISLIGTYLSNTLEPCRICVFATDDGGRSWYNKYELGDDHRSCVGNTYDLSSHTAYSGTLEVYGRTTIYPSDAVKEPEYPFSWNDGVAVTSISSADKAVVTTASAHGLKTGQNIAFTGTTSTHGWMLNPNITSSSTDCGNGVIFKAKVLSSTSFELHEHVMNPHTNLTCRHIHHINRVKDGWIVGTGEMYPDGWIFFMQMKASDAFVTHRAYQEFNIVRLNSSEGSIQRLMGATMYDDQESTMVFAVDNELTPRRNVIMPPGRTESFSRNSTGIYKGRLQDIDDMDLFDCIYEAKQVAYFFKEIKGVYIYCGQQGEFAISFDQGESWTVEDLERRAQTCFGESGKIVVIDEYIIAIR